MNKEKDKHTWANPSWWFLLVMLPWAIGVVGSIYGWKVDRNIALREATANGVITAHHPEDHNTYDYRFEVNGTNFTGRAGSRKDQLKLGESVTVYYDTRNPHENAMKDFSEMSFNSLGPVPILIFGIAAVALYIYVRRRRILAATRLQTS